MRKDSQPLARPRVLMRIPDLNRPSTSLSLLPVEDETGRDEASGPPPDRPDALGRQPAAASRFPWLPLPSGVVLGGLAALVVLALLVLIAPEPSQRGQPARDAASGPSTAIRSQSTGDRPADIGGNPPIPRAPQIILSEPPGTPAPKAPGQPAPASPGHLLGPIERLPAVGDAPGPKLPAEALLPPYVNTSDFAPPQPAGGQKSAESAVARLEPRIEAPSAESTPNPPRSGLY